VSATLRAFPPFAAAAPANVLKGGADPVQSRNGATLATGPAHGRTAAIDAGGSLPCRMLRLRDRKAGLGRNAADFTQVPPTVPFSTMATRLPSSAPRIAATMPPAPAPAAAASHEDAPAR
jgi:hypothetical protein